MTNKWFLGLATSAAFGAASLLATIPAGAQVVYAPDSNTADKALTAKAAMFARLGVHVHLCGKVNL